MLRLTRGRLRKDNGILIPCSLGMWFQFGCTSAVTDWLSVYLSNKCPHLTNEEVGSACDVSRDRPWQILTLADKQGVAVSLPHQHSKQRQPKHEKLDCQIGWTRADLLGPERHRRALVVLHICSHYSRKCPTLSVQCNAACIAYTLKSAGETIAIVICATKILDYYFNVECK